MKGDLFRALDTAHPLTFQPCPVDPDSCEMAVCGAPGCVPVHTLDHDPPHDRSAGGRDDNARSE